MSWALHLLLNLLDGVLPLQGVLPALSLSDDLPCFARLIVDHTQLLHITIALVYLGYLKHLRHHVSNLLSVDLPSIRVILVKIQITGVVDAFELVDSECVSPHEPCRVTETTWVGPMESTNEAPPGLTG